MTSDVSTQNVSEQLNELQNELQMIKTTLLSLNIKAAKLDIDLISTIDPKDVHQVKENAMICNACCQRCETRCEQDVYSKEEAMKIEIVVSEKEE